MSNPFEKYFQATERQQSKLDKVLSTPSASLFQGYEPPNYSTPPEKSAGDILNDAAIATAKTIVGVPQALVGLADIAAYGIDSAISDTPVENTGYIGKAFENAGFRFKDAQDIISAGYSDAYKSQQTGLHNAGEFNLNDGLFSQHNADVLANKAAYVADNPALAVNTTLESLGYILAGGALGTAAKAGAATLAARAAAMRVGAVEGAAAGSIAGTAGAIGGRVAGGLAGAVRTPTTAGLAAAEASIMNSVGQRVALGALGEGGVSAGILQENIRNQTEDGLTSPEQTNLAAVGGAGVGLLGYGFGRLANRAGAADIDSALIRSTAPTTVAGYLKNNPVTRVGKGALIEGLEEVPQENLENFVENLATDKGEGNILYGAADSTVLGFGAGALMGGAINLPTGLSDAGKDIKSGLGKVKDAVTSAASLKSFETLSNPEHKNYNPAQAFNLQLKNLESNDETVRTQAQASVDKITTDLNTSMATVGAQIAKIEAAMKAMPPVPQMTDAQHLEVAALRKEYDSLQAKSEQLTEHLIGFLDAQVSAQENRDAKKGTQFTEEQAKADIATLTQPIPNQTVWSNQDTDIPVEVIGEPETDEQGNELTKVRYTPQEGADPIESYVPTSELVSTQGSNDVAQQEALNRVQRHFSKYSNDDLDLLATSPILSEAQRNSLRLMSKSKRELAAIQDPSQVFDNILNGYVGKTAQESHRGLNQYTDMVNTAVATKNAQLASLALDGLGAFTDDHTAKRDAINEAFGLVQKGTYAEVHALRTQEGTWGLVPFTTEEVKAGKNAAGAEYLSKEALNKVGGFNVHINSDKNGAITQINNETQLIQDRHDALSQVAESFVGVTPKPVDTSTAPTVDTPIVTEPSDTTAPVDNPAPEAPATPTETKTPVEPEPIIPEYTWGRYPNGKPNLEVSSHGNAFSKQFSAFIAKLSDGRTIEEAYQLDVKGYRAHGNDWRLGKGKPPINGKTPEELWIAYKDLWKQFFKENPALFAQMKVEAKGKVLTDKFAKSAVSQARAIAELLNEDISVAATVPTPSQDTPAVTEDAKQVPVGTKAEPNDKATDTTPPVEVAPIIPETIQEAVANDSRVLTELNLSVQQIRDVTSDLKNHVSLETVNTNTSRQTAQLGSDYTYSGKTYVGQTIPTHIQAWMDAVNKALGTAYNSVLVQYYPANTKSGIGFHKDNEKEQFDTTQPVVSLSIGQTIPFVVHEQLNTPVTFNLKSGDVFKFDGNKLHGIATQNHKGERYSLTLRQFHKAKTPVTTPPVSGKAKDVVAELKQSHSGLLSTETKGTLDTLLDLSINLFPDTLVQFIKDVSQIPARLGVTKFTFGKTVFDPDNARQAYVFINPKGKVGKDGNVVSDLYETIAHEFIHAATVGYLNSNFEGTQYKTLLSLVDAVNEYLDSQPNESEDSIVQALRNIVRHENPVAQVQELLAYGLTHSVVSEWAKVTPYAWSTETNKGISDASQVLLDGNTPKTVYDALLAVYGNIIQIEEKNNALLQAKRTPNDNGTIEGGVGGTSNTNDTPIKEQSTKSDGGTRTGNAEIEQTSTESQAIPAELTGENAKVTVLQGVTDEVAAEERKKPFNLRNILKGYFTQSTTKEGATGANPLVTVKDFISNFDVPTQVGKWLNDRRKPTQKQLEQVEHFKEFHKAFSKALDNVFNTRVAGTGAYGTISDNSNLVGYMDTGDGIVRKLDENVITALALSAYSYLIKQGNKVMNTNEELETLFRFKKGMRAPLHIEQMFRFAGQEMPVVVKALGTDAAKTLGLKVRADQDPTLQDRLNTSLGILAMEAMANAGFIVIETLQDHPTDEKNKPLTDFLTTIKAVRESKAHTIEDEYDFEVDTDAETQIKKFTMVRPNAKMEGIGNSVFEKGIIETEVDGKIVRTETLTLNRPVLVKGLPLLTNSVAKLLEASEDTKGFLSYLFGVDVGYTMPLKEMPKKFFQKLINGTDASVPSAQVALLTEAQKHSFTMRTNTVAVFAAMQKLGENSQFLKEVLGIWVDAHVLSRTHVTERDSLQAKAQNDWTAVLNGLEWAEATLDENGQYTQFYDTQFVAQNQRQHLNSNMFSAQSSQIHRAMAALTGFSTTIDLSQDEQGTVKDEALLNLFYQAVGEGLEGLDDYLKADILSKADAGLHQFFTVDKVYGDYYVPALKAFLETDASKNAIKAMRVLIETGTIVTTQQKAIAWFVGKGKMGAQSLQSLIALAELDIAQANGTTFTTTIGLGSDGVNHGVSAANMLTGVISKDMRQQTGIFPIAEKREDQIDNMQEVYRRKITDYYVDFGKVMAAKLRDLIPTFVGKLNTDFVEGMQALFPKFEALDDTGELKNLLAMRKMAKIWAIPFNYSAGKAALQRALARGFLAGIYGEMNKLANEALDIIDAKKKEGLTAEQLAALDVKLETVKLKTTTLQDNLNKVLRKYDMSVALPAPQLLNEEAQGKLSQELENTLMEAAIELHGEAAWQATEEFAKDYLEVRNVYTEVEKASFSLFNVVRNQLIEEKKASRKYSNVAAKVAVKGKTVQYTAEEINAQEAEYFGLTTVEMAEIDAVLAAMRPMFNTALSIGSESTNDAGSVTNPSGVSVRKHKMQREPASGLRAVSTFYGKPRAESRNIGLTKEVEENAGVAASANAIQSIDAFVAAKVQGFMNALNVHDAAIFGLKDFLKGVKKQNEEHLKALTNYQLGLEHAKMLVKVYQGYKAFMATQELALKSEDVKVKENAQKLITKAKKQREVLLWGEQMFKGDTALRINGETVYKGGLIPKLQAANVNIKDDAKIEEAISAFINYALKQDLQKLEVLLDTFSIHQFAGEGGMHQLTDDNRASIDEQKALVNKAKEDLQAELKDKTVEEVAEVKTPEATKQVSPKVATAEKPMSPLVKFLESKKDAEMFVGDLIQYMKSDVAIDAKLNAQQQEVLKALEPLLNASTKVVYADATYEGYGYFDEPTNTIHIKSEQSKGSKVDSQLAIHELLHSVLSLRIKALNASIAAKTTEATKTGKPASFTPAEAALNKLDELRQIILSRVKRMPLLNEMLKSVDEFISYGLTDQRLQQVLGAVPVERNGRTAPKVNSKWRTFVLAVMKVTGFKSGGIITALSAFAMDTAALLETIGSVTPVMAPNNGERLFSTQSAEDHVNGQSSLDIMTALPHSNTGSFNQQLDRLITGEIGQLYNQDEAAKARIDEIQTFTASDALNAGFTLSRKEQYVQQALQYAVAAYMKLHAGGANVGQLRRVYHAAKVKIDPTGKDFHEGDWATATQQEKDIAKAKYDFMFDSTRDSDFMSRFVSMALASESVSKILDIALPLTKLSTQDKTWFETVNDWLSYVMAWLTNKYVRLNPTLGASNQLAQLMENLVKLDIRARQEGVALHQKAWNSIGLITTPLNNLIKKGQDAALKGEGLRNSRYLPVRALGAAIVLRSEEAAKAIPQLIIDMRNNELPNTKMGEAANILMEAASAGSMRNAFDVLTRQTNLNAKNRQDIVDNVKKAVNGWFKTPLTKLQHKAVTTGLLHTDAQALLENYSVGDIVDMVLHEGKLTAEIVKLKKEIAKNPNGNDMLNAAEQLGYYMVTRIGGKGLVKNALGISIGLGTQYFTSVKEADPKLVNQLNTLVSMLAMTHVSNADKGILASIYKTDAEGVHATIQLHSGLVNDSMKDFQENPLNMVKGWMPEITNPFIEIKTADSMTQREQMESEGWVVIGELKRDAMDKGAPKYLMKHNDFGYQRLVSGAVDLQRTARSGTEAIDRTNPKYLAITQARYRNAANRASIPNKDFDPSKQQRGLIAAYDTDGVVLGYNYEMDNETRDAHLDRKHNIGELLGTMGGLNYYKPAKKKQSNAVAQVLFDDYRENYSQNPNAYIKLSHKSTDPKVVEMWRMLPQDFKDQATALYGKGNPIIIRNEVFNMAFGFKKFSVVSYAFDTKAADRNKFQSGFVGFAEATSKFKSGVMGTFGGTNRSTARADFAKAEHVVQEIVKAIKDFIVIRSGTTMFWNIFANVLMLMANDINPVTIVKDWVFAVSNVRAYQKLNSQLIQARADLVAGKDPTALKQKIGALKAELKANPLSEYINAGLLSSIVEDVNIQSGDYTYVSAFKQSVDGKTQWIPKPVKTAAKVLAIAPSTKLYQFLATTTQLSDFVAKYSMSKHLQSKGMIQSESIVEASQTFINYDVPTSQGLQYANDMGLFMFTKFFLRIQAVLMKLLGKRAGSVIAQHLLVENLTGAEGILSPMMLGHIGNNPIEASVFGLPSAFFSIGTVDAVTDVGAPF